MQRFILLTHPPIPEEYNQQLDKKTMLQYELRKPLLMFPQSCDTEASKREPLFIIGDSTQATGGRLNYHLVADYGSYRYHISIA